MTDMCNNGLLITGPESEINDFSNAARGPTSYGEDSYLSFHKLHPEPNVLDEYPFWDDTWRLKNWGTTLEVVAETPEWSPRTSKVSRDYFFRSFGTHPEPLIEHVSRKWPTIRFEMKWHSSRHNRSGLYVYKAGKCLLKKSSPGNKWWMHQTIDMTLNTHWNWDWDMCANSFTMR